MEPNKRYKVIADKNIQRNDNTYVAPINKVMNPDAFKTEEELLQERYKQNAKQFLQDRNNHIIERNPGLINVSPEFALMTAGVGSGIKGIAGAAIHGAAQGAMANVANISGGEQSLSGLAGDMVGGATIGAGIKAVGPYVKDAVQNTYKINPFAFKPKPEAYYRMIGENGIEDAIESGVIRPPQYSYQTPQGNPKIGDPNIVMVDGRLRQKLPFPEYDNAYYNKGVPLDDNYAIARSKQINPKRGKPISTRKKGYRGPEMVEVNKNDNLFSSENSNSVKESVFYSKENIPINTKGVKLYRQNWLKGYKEIKPNIQSKPDFK